MAQPDYWQRQRKARFIPCNNYKIRNNLVGLGIIYRGLVFIFCPSSRFREYRSILGSVPLAEPSQYVSLYMVSEILNISFARLDCAAWLRVLAKCTVRFSSDWIVFSCKAIEVNAESYWKFFWDSFCAFFSILSLNQLSSLSITLVYL